MHCDCTGQVPVVSDALAGKLLARLSAAQRARALALSLDWLTENPLGLPCRGIHGRPYAEDERDAIAVEAGNYVLHSACPFAGSDGCAVGELPDFTAEAEDAAGAPYWFLPAILAIKLDLDALHRVQDEHRVPDGKVVGFSRRSALERPDNARAIRLLNGEQLEKAAIAADWMAGRRDTLPF